MYQIKCKDDLSFVPSQKSTFICAIAPFTHPSILYGANPLCRACLSQGLTYSIETYNHSYGQFKVTTSPNFTYTTCFWTMEQFCFLATDTNQSVSSANQQPIPIIFSSITLGINKSAMNRSSVLRWSVTSINAVLIWDQMTAASRVTRFHTQWHR